MDNNNDEWWKDVPPENLEEQVDESQTVFDAEQMDEEQISGIQKFMNISLVAHDEVAKEFIALVKEGHIDPIQAYVALKRVGKINELCLDSQKGDAEFREIVHTTVQNALDGGKSVDIYGANLRIQDTGIIYDYSECGDKVLNELYEIQETVKDLIKKREAHIKILLPPNDTKTLGIRSEDLIDSKFPKFELEEAITESKIFPPIRKSGSSVICTFKKPK